MYPTVAILGRPNVGKSTLFNRLTHTPLAIVSDEPGVTRDRLYGEVEWNGKKFNLIDTGGLLVNPKNIFETEIKRQVQMAAEEADVILLVVDALTEITQQDSDIVDLLRKSVKKPVIVVVNKVDNEYRRSHVDVFYSLGRKSVIGISAISGSGTGELLDEVAALLPEQKREEEEETEEERPRIVILGKPNVGKSTLVNALLNEERTLVTDIAGTTRDAIDTRYTLYGKDISLVDTAGLRRKDRSKENVEFYSAIRTVKSIDNADVCMILFDASEETPFNAQDISIFSLAIRKGKGVVLLGNKWDQVADKDSRTALEFEKYIKAKTAPLVDLPLLFISALEKQRIYKALDVALDVAKRRRAKIQTSALNTWLGETMENYAPPLRRGRSVKINYATQLPGRTPTFCFFCNYPESVSGSYKNYLENKLREKFPLTGIPVRFIFKKKS